MASGLHARPRSAPWRLARWPPSARRNIKRLMAYSARSAIWAIALLGLAAGGDLAACPRRARSIWLSMSSPTLAPVRRAHRHAPMKRGGQTEWNPSPIWPGWRKHRHEAMAAGLRDAVPVLHGGPAAAGRLLRQALCASSPAIQVGLVTSSSVDRRALAQHRLGLVYYLRLVKIMYLRRTGPAGLRPPSLASSLSGRCIAVLSACGGLAVHHLAASPVITAADAARQSAAALTILGREGYRRITASTRACPAFHQPRSTPNWPKRGEAEFRLAITGADCQTAGYGTPAAAPGIQPMPATWPLTLLLRPKTSPSVTRGNCHSWQLLAAAEPWRQTFAGLRTRPSKSNGPTTYWAMDGAKAGRHPGSKPPGPPIGRIGWLALGFGVNLAHAPEGTEFRCHEPSWAGHCSTVTARLRLTVLAEKRFAHWYAMPG